MLLLLAGVMMCPRQLTEDGYELQFATNHLGHYLFTLLLLPRIIKSAPAKIINLSSLAHTWGDGNMHFEDINLEKSYSPTGAYGRSKLANILFTTELAKRLQGKIPLDTLIFTNHEKFKNNLLCKESLGSVGSYFGSFDSFILTVRCFFK